MAVSKSEKVGFEGLLEGAQAGSFSDFARWTVPQLWSNEGKVPVPIGAQPGLGDMEKLRWPHLRVVPEIILGAGRRHSFVLWGGGGCFVYVSEGWVKLSWGSRRIWSIVGQGLIKALMCPEGWGVWFTELSWGSGGSDSMCVLGVAGSEKKCGPPRIISGTALKCPRWSVGNHQLSEICRGKDHAVHGGLKAKSWRWCSTAREASGAGKAPVWCAPVYLPRPPLWQPHSALAAASWWV